MVLGKILKRKKAIQDPVIEEVVKAVAKTPVIPALKIEGEIEEVEEEEDFEVEEEVEVPVEAEESVESVETVEPYSVQQVATQTEQVIYNSTTEESLTLHQAVVKILNILDGLS